MSNRELILHKQLLTATVIRSKGEILVQVMPFGTRRVLAEAAAGRNGSGETNAAVWESGAARNQQGPSEERCNVITAETLRIDARSAGGELWAQRGQKLLLCVDDATFILQREPWRQHEALWH